MAELLTVARPYARAAFSQARSVDGLQTWDHILQVLRLAAQDAAFIAMHKNPSAEKTQSIALLCDVVREAVKPGEAVMNQVENFVRLLSLHQRIMVLPEIAVEYTALLEAHEKLVAVEVISSAPFDEAQRQAMQAALEKRFNSKVTVQYGIDENLMGGALVRSGNWVMDGSVKSKLARLSDCLG